MALAIETRGLVKRFRDVVAVDGLDLEVERGEVFAFLGPNGAGKTTTLHLLLGLLKPDEGHARVFGVDATKDPLGVRSRCGVLLEHDGVYERLSVQANLDLWGRFHGLSWNQRNVRTRHLLQELDLYDRRRARAGSLSRGMKRKVAIARALLPEPELVILDEPTVGLDPRSIVEIRDRLRGLASEQGRTVFLTTHNLDEAERLADRVAVVDHGRVVASGRPSDLADEHGADQALIMGGGLTRAVAEKAARLEGVLAADSSGAGDTLRVRLRPHAPLAPVIEAVVASGGDVEATERRRESLGEVFLLLTRRGDAARPVVEARTPQRPLAVAQHRGGGSA